MSGLNLSGKYQHGCEHRRLRTLNLEPEIYLPNRSEKNRIFAACFFNILKP